MTSTVWEFEASGSSDGWERFKAFTPRCFQERTGFDFSHTLCVPKVYTFKSAPVVPLPISFSIYLTGTAETPGTSCQPPPRFHSLPPSPPIHQALSLFLHALRGSGLCPAAHRSLHVCVGGIRGPDRFLELLYDKSGLSSACLQRIHSKPLHFEQYQTNCLLWAFVHVGVFALASRHECVFSFKIGSRRFKNITVCFEFVISPLIVVGSAWHPWEFLCVLNRGYLHICDAGGVWGLAVYVCRQWARACMCVCVSTTVVWWGYISERGVSGGTLEEAFGRPQTVAGASVGTG